MRKIAIIKRKDISDSQKNKQMDSKPVKMPKKRISDWLTESLNNINERKQIETSAFFN